MTFLLYGANGYTGELIARRAHGAGMRPTLAGRDRESVARLAAGLQLPHCVATVDDGGGLDEAIEPGGVVLNCAGPFSRTAAAVAASCIRRRAHYLDITGELGVFESLAALDAQARRAGVMLLPGVGFDVVPSDCLAAYVAQRLPSAVRLAIAIKTSGGMSRGTAVTAIEGLGVGNGSGAVRRAGRIVRVPPAWKTRLVDFGAGAGAVRVTTMPWGDVSTAFHSTGIPDVEVYMAIPSSVRRAMRYGRFLLPLVSSAPVHRWLERRVRRGPAGPNSEQRARGRTAFWAQAVDAAGASATALLSAPEGYELTVRTAIECVQRVLRGDVRLGFQTPSRAYGADLILAIHGVSRVDA